MITSDKEPGDTKWNNHQERYPEHERNEGFSAQNIPSDYNPSDEKLEDRLKTERETDEDGNVKIVDRARFPDDAPQEDNDNLFEAKDNSVIENPESLQNRDRNYDLDPNRYPPKDPENHRNRGNIDLDNE